LGHEQEWSKFLRAFIAGIHLWMTDEKATERVLAKRLKITDTEILDATYVAYKKLTEKKPYQTLKGIEFQIDDVAKRNSVPLDGASIALCPR